MSQLVRQNDLDLVVRVLRQERIGHQHAPGPAASDERGVGPSCFGAEAPLVHAQHAHTGALRQRLQAILQVLPIQRPEAIEEREQNDWSEPREK